MLCRAPAGLCNIDFQKSIVENTPMNVLGNIQKEILKLLPPVMCKNHMKLSFCKELLGEAISILQQPGMELFGIFFLNIALHFKGVI